jgi:hypothetical protein
LLDMRVNAKSSTGAAAGWVVEFDGPSHFLTCRFASWWDLDEAAAS